MHYDTQIYKGQQVTAKSLELPKHLPEEKSPVDLSYETWKFKKIRPAIVLLFLANVTMGGRSPWVQRHRKYSISLIWKELLNTLGCLETDCNRVRGKLWKLQLLGPHLCLAVPTYLAAGEAIHLDEGLYSQRREGSSGVRGKWRRYNSLLFLLLQWRETDHTFGIKWDRSLSSP